MFIGHQTGMCLTVLCGSFIDFYVPVNAQCTLAHWLGILTQEVAKIVDKTDSCHGEQ